MATADARSGASGWMRRAVAAAALLSALGSSSTAAAFCRTTTCDSKKEFCPRDGNECMTTGVPLAWDTQCIAYGVHAAGSPKHGITHDDASLVAADAFRTWLTADCGGGTIPLRVWDLSLQAGPPTCGHAEFNQCAPNANVIFFREDDWPYAGGDTVLAYTNVTFVPSTGQILDADIEVNAATAALTITGEDGASDLASLLTHEVGHFLGLDHTLAPHATMQRGLSNATEMRSLEPDDVLGICTIYPPGETEGECTSPQLVHGFTRHCVQTLEETQEESPSGESCAAAQQSGCSCDVPGGTPPARNGAGLTAVVLALAWRRVRRVG